MKLKRIIYSITIILLSIILLPKSVVALTSGVGRFTTLYVGVAEHDAVYGSPALYYYTMDGAKVYCLEMATKILKTNYEAYGYSDPRIGYALSADHGYTYNEAADFQIRQAVIWALLGQINIENLYNGDPGCVQAAKNLYYAAASYSGNIDEVNASTTSLDFHIEGSQYISQPISISKAGNNDYYDISLGGFPGGTYITDMNGNVMQTGGINWDSTFQIRIPLEVITYDITSIDMGATAVGSYVNTTMAYRSIGIPSQATLSPAVARSTSTATKKFYLSHPILARGNLEVKKNDEYGEPIGQATFMVSNGSYTQTQTTGADGVARFTDLPAGNYTITETFAPEGYYNDRQNLNVTVITGMTVTATKTDKAEKGRVKIIKSDRITGATPQGDAGLGGAEYKIYANQDIYAPNGKTLLFSANQEVATLITKDNGETDYAILPLGKYYYRESLPSVGYNLNDEELVFSIDYANQDVELVYKSLGANEDVKTNDIEIIKKLQRTASTPQMNLSGAQFSATLKSDRSKVYYSNITDSNGYCVIKELPYGTYEIEEVVVPDKALKIDNFEVFVEEDSKDRGPYRYTKENIAKKMRIKIYKEDIETGRTTQGDARLEDAEYTIYRDEGLTDAVETVKISKQDDGSYSAYTGDYLVGTYYIKETKRPEGYLIDETVYTVTQNAAEQTQEFSYHEITSKELVEKGNIYIVKYMDNNTNFDRDSTTKNPATGAELTLTLDSKPETTYKATINDIGYAEFIDIPYGWYTITETKSIEFVDIMDPQPVYIAKNEQKLYYIVQDPRNKRKLQIVKVDSESGKTIPLAGASFRVWDVAQNRYIKQTYNYPVPTEIEEFVTSNDGTLVLPDGLIPGQYELEEVTAPFGYTLNDTRVSFTIDATTPENPEEVKTVSVEFPNTAQKARVVVFKKGEVLSGTQKEGEITRPTYEIKGLEGVEYTITAKQDIVTPDGTTRMHQGDTVKFKTDATGVGKSPELYLGEYSIRESASIPGYLIQEEENPFSLEYRGQEISIYDKNMDYIDARQKLELKIKKNMQETKFEGLLKEAYKDVRLGIYSRESLKDPSGKSIIDSDVLVDILSIQDDGTTTDNYDLPLGKYYIKEIETNDNYVLSEKEYDFEFLPEDNVNPVMNINLKDEISNDLTELGKFKINKYAVENKNIIQRLVDGINGVPDRTHLLKGAKFKFYWDNNGTPQELVTKDGVSEYITNDNGEILIQDLPFGKYYYQEIEAPKGYETDTTMYPFEITSKHVEEPKVEEVSNKLVIVKVFTKRDIVNSQPIPDCEFEILDDNENPIYKDKTDENGDYYMPTDLIEVGKKYYYREISAPDIYELNDQLHEFSLKEDGTFTMNEVNNLRKTITIKLTKKDFLGGEKIPNCTFRLESLESDFKIEGTTDENGEYYFENIPYGEYTYTEISAPENYRIDTTPHRFTVDENMKELNITNEKYVNTSDINVMLLSIVLIVSIGGIIFMMYRNKQKTEDK